MMTCLVSFGNQGENAFEALPTAEEIEEWRSNPEGLSLDRTRCDEVRMGYEGIGKYNGQGWTEAKV